MLYIYYMLSDNFQIEIEIIVFIIFPLDFILVAMIKKKKNTQKTA